MKKIFIEIATFFTIIITLLMMNEVYVYGMNQSDDEQETDLDDNYFDGHFLPQIAKRNLKKSSSIPTTPPPTPRTSLPSIHSDSLCETCDNPEQLPVITVGLPPQEVPFFNRIRELVPEFTKVSGVYAWVNKAIKMNEKSPADISPQDVYANVEQEMKINNLSEDDLQNILKYKIKIADIHTLLDDIISSKKLSSNSRLHVLKKLIEQLLSAQRAHEHAIILLAYYQNLTLLSFERITRGDLCKKFKATKTLLEHYNETKQFTRQLFSDLFNKSMKYNRAIGGKNFQEIQTTIINVFFNATMFSDKNHHDFLKSLLDQPEIVHTLVSKKMLFPHISDNNLSSNKLIALVSSKASVIKSIRKYTKRYNNLQPLKKDLIFMPICFQQLEVKLNKLRFIKMSEALCNFNLLPEPNFLITPKRTKRPPLPAGYDQFVPDNSSASIAHKRLYHRFCIIPSSEDCF